MKIRKQSICWSIQWSSEDGRKEFSTVFDSKTVLSAHNSHLEKNYRTTASQRHRGSSLGRDYYLIEDDDIAKTLHAQFNREMNRINCLTSTIGDVSTNGAPRKDLRHFYLLLPNPSHANNTPVFYLDRSTKLCDVFAGQTIHRFPMILVLRFGPKDLDTNKYKLVKLPAGSPLHATENAVITHRDRDEEASAHGLGIRVEKPQASSEGVPRNDLVTKTAVVKETKLIKSLKVWIRSAEEAFSNPDDFAMKELQHDSTQVVKRATEYMHTTPIDTAIDDSASSTVRYYQQVRRLVMHLWGSAVSLQWDSKFVLETYRSLKHTIRTDAITMRDLGYRDVGRISPDPQKPAYDRIIEIPDVCVPYIERVCSSFVPNIRQAHKHSSMHEPAPDRKRRRVDESDLPVQLSQDRPNDAKDVSYQHARTEDLRIKRRLGSHESGKIEQSFVPRVKNVTNQEPADELRFGPYSGQEPDILSTHPVNVERLGHRHQGGQYWIQGTLEKGSSREDERTSLDDIRGKYFPKTTTRTTAQDLGDSNSSNLPIVSGSHSTDSEARGSCMQQAQTKAVGRRADGHNMAVLSDYDLAGNNSSEPYIHEDRRRLLEHNNKDHTKVSGALQSSLPSDTGTHEASSHLQHASKPVDTSDLTQKSVQHAEAFLEELGSDLMARGSEVGDTRDKTSTRRTMQSDRPTIDGQQQLISERYERLSGEYGRNPTVRGRGSVLYRSSPNAQGEETAHAKKLGYGSDATGYKKTNMDGLADSRRLRSDP